MRMQEDQSPLYNSLLEEWKKNHTQLPVVKFLDGEEQVIGPEYNGNSWSCGQTVKVHVRLSRVHRVHDRTYHRSPDLMDG